MNDPDLTPMVAWALLFVQSSASATVRLAAYTRRKLRSRRGRDYLLNAGPLRFSTVFGS